MTWSKCRRKVARGFERSFSLTALCLLMQAGAMAQYTFTTYNAPGGVSIYSTPINNNGVIAGTAVDESGHYFGFVRAVDGTINTFTLPSPCPEHDCEAFVTGLNDLGQLVGFVENNVSVTAINFMRDQNGTITELSGPPGVQFWAVQGLTNAGETIAQVLVVSQVYNVFVAAAQAYLRTSAGRYYPLPEPPGIVNPYFSTLNNQGEIIGTGQTSSDPATSANVSFVLNAASNQFVFFPKFYGLSGLNDAGTLIGYQFFQNQRLSFLAASNGSILQTFYPAVPEVGFAEDYPYSINQSGMIAGVFLPTFARISGYVAVPTTDVPAPTVSVISVTGQQAVFSVVDPIAGLYAVYPLCNGCTTAISPFTPGQKTPVTVTATKYSGTNHATVEITAVNPAGNSVQFDPDFATIYSDGAPPNVLSGISSAEHVLTVTNGNRGLSSLTIQVNGRTLALPLAVNETRTINLARWMTSASNTIAFSGYGPPGSEGSIILADPSPTVGRRLR
jgi:hypothetical protein